MKPLEASTGEKSTRGRRKGDNPAQEGGPGWARRKKPIYSHVTGSGNRPRYPPEENPKPLEDMEEGRNMKGREARREGGKVSVCRYPLMASKTGKRFMRSFPVMHK